MPKRCKMCIILPKEDHIVIFRLFNHTITKDKGPSPKHHLLYDKFLRLRSQCSDDLHRKRPFRMTNFFDFAFSAQMTYIEKRLFW